MARTVGLSNWPQYASFHTTSEPLVSGGEWSTEWVPNKSESIAVRVKSDTACQIYFDYSFDGVISSQLNDMYGA